MFNADANLSRVFDLVNAQTELSNELAAALDEAAGDVDSAFEDPGLYDAWTGTAGDVRASILLNLAWAAARHRHDPAPIAPDVTTDHRADGYARELHRHAAEFSESAEAFHGPHYPIPPLPRHPAGALAASLGHDSTDVDTALRTALVLLCTAQDPTGN